MNETIRRGNIPESDDEDEDELSRKKRRLSCSKTEAKLVAGSTFFSGLDFKEAIIDYVLETRYNIKQSRWDKEKLTFKCAMGGQCLWRVSTKEDVLTLERDDADKCVIYKSTHGLYEVELKGNSNRVSLPARTCTCLKWQVSGIPCEHAYGAIIDEGLKWFLLSCFYRFLEWSCRFLDERLHVFG